MDDLIFEEFKGTGNCEIVLDRDLADARLFPAFNLLASGTRKEEKLYDDEYELIKMLRRGIATQTTKEAITKILKWIEKYPNNRELLANLKKDN